MNKDLVILTQKYYAKQRVMTIQLVAWKNTEKCVYSHPHWIICEITAGRPHLGYHHRAVLENLLLRSYMTNEHLRSMVRNITLGWFNSMTSQVINVKRRGQQVTHRGIQNFVKFPTFIHSNFKIKFRALTFSPQIQHHIKIAYFDFDLILIIHNYILTTRHRKITVTPN